ncbi:class II myosin [Mucor velutinosus]|uniref:Class II myosin n=1 Tax=Mucor velutinosus TaxID=708070 RepID=A0AAN7DL03_9FUNG|nr:class II myosin [Mucor velutinosus]
MDDFSTSPRNRSIPNVPLDDGDEVNEEQEQQQEGERIESVWKGILARIMVVPTFVTMIGLKWEHFELLADYIQQRLSSGLNFVKDYQVVIVFISAWTYIINGLCSINSHNKHRLLLWVFMPLTIISSLAYPIYRSSQGVDGLSPGLARIKQYSSFAKHLVDIDTKVTEQASRMEQLFQKTHYSNKQLLEHISLVSSQIREQQAQLNYQREDYRRIWNQLYNQHQYMASVSDDIKQDVIEALQDNAIAVFDTKEEQLKVSPQFFEYMQTTNFIQAFIQHNKHTIRSFIQQELQQFFLAHQDETHSIMKRIEQLPSSLEQLVESAMKKYQPPQSDNEPDFALGSRGGKIIPSRTSKTYRPPLTSKLLLRRALGYYTKITKPLAVLQPRTEVGECWSMNSSNGTVGIYLSEEIYMTSVILEHPSASVLLDDIKNAPQDFKVFGLPTDSPDLPDEPLLLGQFRYDIHSEQRVQKFLLETDRSFQIVIIHFLSNWGNPDFTDIYRIKVSGKPVSQYTVAKEEGDFR